MMLCAALAGFATVVYTGSDVAGFLAGALAGAVGLASQRREPPAASPPPPAVSARMDLPVVVMGAGCGVLGAAAVTESGAPAYCARQDSQSPDSVWSALPERLRTAIPRP
jgi:serine/threonine-protein kinase